MSSLSELVMRTGIRSHEVIEGEYHALDLVMSDLAVLVDVVEAPEPMNAVVERAANERGESE